MEVNYRYHSSDIAGINAAKAGRVVYREILKPELLDEPPVCANHQKYIMRNGVVVVMEFYVRQIDSTNEFLGYSLAGTHYVYETEPIATQRNL